MLRPFDDEQRQPVERKRDEADAGKIKRRVVDLAEMPPEHSREARREADGDEGHAEDALYESWSDNPFWHLLPWS